MLLTELNLKLEENFELDESPQLAEFVNFDHPLLTYYHGQSDVTNDGYECRTDLLLELTLLHIRIYIANIILV